MAVINGHSKKCLADRVSEGRESIENNREGLVGHDNREGLVGHGTSGENHKMAPQESKSTTQADDIPLTLEDDNLLRFDLLEAICGKDGYARPTGKDPGDENMGFNLNLNCTQPAFVDDLSPNPANTSPSPYFEDLQSTAIHSPDSGYFSDKCDQYGMAEFCSGPSAEGGETDGQTSRLRAAELADWRVSSVVSQTEPRAITGVNNPHHHDKQIDMFTEESKSFLDYGCDQGAFTSDNTPDPGYQRAFTSDNTTDPGYQGAFTSDNTPDPGYQGAFTSDNPPDSGYPSAFTSDNIFDSGYPSAFTSENIFDSGYPGISTSENENLHFEIIDFILEYSNCANTSHEMTSGQNDVEDIEGEKVKRLVALLKGKDDCKAPRRNTEMGKVETQRVQDIDDLERWRGENGGRNEVTEQLASSEPGAASLVPLGGSDVEHSLPRYQPPSRRQKSTGSRRTPAGPKRRKGTPLWRFLSNLLKEGKCENIIRWVNKGNGTFKFIKSQEVAKMWGMRKNKLKPLRSENMFRAIRHYYKRGVMNRIADKRLIYQFGINAYDWD